MFFGVPLLRKCHGFIHSFLCTELTRTLTDEWELLRAHLPFHSCVLIHEQTQFIFLGVDLTHQRCCVEVSTGVAPRQLVVAVAAVTFNSTWVPQSSVQKSMRSCMYDRVFIAHIWYQTLIYVWRIQWLHHTCWLVSTPLMYSPWCKGFYPHRKGCERETLQHVNRQRGSLDPTWRRESMQSRALQTRSPSSAVANIVVQSDGSRSNERMRPKFPISHAFCLHVEESLTCTL